MFPQDKIPVIDIPILEEKDTFTDMEGFDKYIEEVYGPMKRNAET